MQIAMDASAENIKIEKVETELSEPQVDVGKQKNLDD
jgi:hypothetical protein